MSDAVIRVDNLGKRYVLRHQAAGRGGYKRFSEELVEWVRSPWKRLSERAASQGTEEDFWALQSVSFEIRRGDVVGVIGRNGAGKSTLLKVLSRITEPTTGRVELHGRVASLLEVGTGFHPELTGRENIFLNGAILGMTVDEIRRKFDEIVAFAEVERFLDTPVKRYSSGMYVRLAFSVAAHLEPEILVVDEVLAVGDHQFQRKCLGKMNEVASSGGRTVLFVSHNMEAVINLCRTGILLRRGQLLQVGPVQSVVQRYQTEGADYIALERPVPLTAAVRKGSGAVRFRSVELRTASGAGRIAPGDGLELHFEIEAERDMEVPNVAVVWRSVLGQKLINADSVESGQVMRARRGLNCAVLRLGQVNLKAGEYVLGLFLGHSGCWETYDVIEDAGRMEVHDRTEDRQGQRPTHDGIVHAPFRYEFEPV